jgi:hypothetical protein|tara:strand:- start:4657 stop:6459 length:1803 start_codon:yes stop_codon:yes gene_type:complete
MVSTQNLITMAYFNHAFNKTFVAKSVDTAGGTATSALTAGQIALVRDSDWTSVALPAGAIGTGNLAYIVQGSYYQSDTIGNNPGNGGYKESVKSKGINPRFITNLWKQDTTIASNATAKLCLASDCAPCGKTQFMRIDVKGSPALRFLNHNAYAIADSGNVCCVDGQEYIDPAVILATMGEMVVGNGLMKDNIKYAAGDPLITPFVKEGDPDGVKTFSAIAAGGVGTGYAVAATALATTVSPTGGSGLTLKVDSIAAAVATVGTLVGGTGYTAAVGVATTVAPAGGSGATITTLTSAGAGTPVTTATLVAGGAGYSVGDVLTITGGGADATVTVATIAATGAIKSVTVLNEGSGYDAADVVTVTGGNSDATLTVATVSVGSVEVTSTTAAGVVTSEYYSIAQALGKASSGNYTPSTDPNGATKVSACITFIGAYVDTVFGNCSFDTRDHYNAEPVEIIVSQLDETGNPCNDCGVATRTSGSMEQTQGERVVRDLIMSERYRQSPYNQGNADSSRIRQIEMSTDILDAVDRAKTYVAYYVKHSVPRYNNPTGVFDNDQYVYKIYIDPTIAGLETATDSLMTGLVNWAATASNALLVETYTL